MGNQPAVASSSYVFTMWVLIVLLILIYSTFIIAMGWYYKRLQKINNWQDSAVKDLDKVWCFLHTLAEEVKKLAVFVDGHTKKTEKNLQLIADKINEMNEYYESTETQTVESVQEVVSPSPVVKKEEVLKEIDEDNETLPNNVIKFPGPKKSK